MGGHHKYVYNLHLSVDIFNERSRDRYTQKEVSVLTRRQHYHDVKTIQRNLHIQDNPYQKFFTQNIKEQFLSS